MLQIQHTYQTGSKLVAKYHFSMVQKRTILFWDQTKEWFTNLWGMWQISKALMQVLQGKKVFVRWPKVISLQSDGWKISALDFLSCKWELPDLSMFSWVKKGTTATEIEFLTPMHISACNTMIAMAIES